MENANNQKGIGLIITIVGIALFIALMGDLLFRVIGGFLAINLINYGLQMQRLPNVWIYALNVFKFKQ